MTGSSLESMETFGMPESERGGVGAVHCGKGWIDCSVAKPCGSGECWGVIHWMPMEEGAIESCEMSGCWWLLWARR